MPPQPCRAGGAIPAHTHDGIETVLLLQGRFQDAGAEYGRGDLVVADNTIDHRLVVTGALECICYLVLGGPVRLTGPPGRLLPGGFGAWRGMIFLRIIIPLYIFGGA